MRQWWSLETILRVFLGLLIVVFVLSNYASYLSVVSSTLSSHTNGTERIVLDTRHIGWSRTSRDPFKVETEATTTGEKGLLQDFIDLVAPTESPEALSGNETDPLAVENAVSLERDTGE